MKNHFSIRLSDIAQATGVSVVTVGKVLNNSGGKNTKVSEKTSERIRSYAQKMGYRPNLIARSLKNGKNPSLLCLLPDEGDDLMANLMFGISETACRENYLVHFLFGNNLHDFSYMVKNARIEGNSGILSYPPQKITSDIGRLTKEYLNQNGKILLLNIISNTSSGEELPAEFQKIPQLNIDEVYGGSLVASHLLKQGCTKFYYIYSEPEILTARYSGYASVLKENGFMPIRTCAPDWNEIIKSKEKTGIFAFNDACALKVEFALVHRGIIPGEQILLVGFNDMHYCKNMFPPLSSVHQPMRSAGARAIKKLINMISGLTEETENIRPSLVVRESSGGIISRPEQ